MQIQEVITALSVIMAELTEIKMQKVRAEITEHEAKAKAAKILKEALKNDILGKAVEEWKV